jgi:hypothetical protein
MSKKRGLSAEDKRRVILSIYHEEKVAFNLKEIETIGSRMVRWNIYVLRFYKYVNE